MNSIYSFSALNNKGVEVPMSEYKGRVVLIVNTASKCGFTPQYKDLETLYQRYKEKGLVVLGFPCDQFANQEPGSDEEIASFCERNFGVTFPLMQKVEVNGPNAHPLFDFIKKATKGFWGSKVKWNFTKFLIDTNGVPVGRFSSVTTPLKLEKRIVELLK